MQRKWWHDRTAYQIYPKSFLDTNGDGVGDLRGIIQKLDYLKDLGIGIVWLCPIYASPQADQGYDISDYESIDPRFGTMADFDELIREAKKRDIAVLMDLVVNHCSDEHPWFKKACEDPDGRYGRYFTIRDWRAGEALPTNWRSYFGGPCWDLLPGHDDKVYLHVFHKKQPDLNWENPELREEIYAMMNRWFDRGLAGFRVDAIMNIKKAHPFRNYPADRPDGMSSLITMLDDAQGIDALLNEMADRTFRPHDAFTVGEVVNLKPERLEAFIGERGYLSSMFDFHATVIGRSPMGWYAAEDPTPERYKAACFEAQRLAGDRALFSNIIENHDEPRGASRYLPEGARTPRAKKMLGGLSYFLRGVPFIYQGQEIGMENTCVRDIAQVDDVSARAEYEVALAAGLSPDEAIRRVVNRFSRDNARTPFQWDAGPNAGFTTGTPWLSVNPNFAEINAADQLGRSDSVLEFYRAMIALRADPEYRDTFVYGTFRPWLEAQTNLMAYLRAGERTVLVAGNFQSAPQRMALPGPVGRVLMNNLTGLECAEDGRSVTLEGYQFVVLAL